MLYFFIALMLYMLHHSFGFAFLTVYVIFF
uniref:Uncharacterized protein n=1 Tax=Arundo donax TaxID=35708 RepID=A0A0A9EAA8_ARUDO